jgi:hypothetical protein
VCLRAHGARASGAWLTHALVSYALASIVPFLQVREGFIAQIDRVRSVFATKLHVARAKNGNGKIDRANEPPAGGEGCEVGVRGVRWG